MKHTLFFQPGLWVARGVYIDGNNRRYQASGKGKVSHTADMWLNEVYLDIEELENRISNRYEIVPFPPGKDFTTFVAVNPVVGKMKGTLMMVEDSFLWTFHTERQEYLCYEYIIRISDTRYSNRGFAFWHQRKLFSWAIELERVD